MKQHVHDHLVQIQSLNQTVCLLIAAHLGLIYRQIEGKWGFLEWRLDQVLRNWLLDLNEIEQ